MFMKEYLQNCSELRRLSKCKIQAGNDEKWAAETVRILAKKIKKEDGCEKLLYAINNPMGQSDCVPLPQNMDGRIQVFEQKIYPHVATCKLWRWSDVKGAPDLKALPCCKFPYFRKCRLSCINPYHYGRINRLPPIIVPAFKDECRCNPVFQNSDNYDDSTANFYKPENYVYMDRSENYMCVDKPDNYMCVDRPKCDDHFSSPLQNLSDSSKTYAFEDTPVQKNSMFEDTSLHCQTPVQETRMFHTPLNDYSSYAGSLPDRDFPYYLHPNSPSPTMTSSDNRSNGQEAEFGGANPYTLVKFESQKDWGSINYYEMHQRVGTFQMKTASVVIDGFTDPTNRDGRLCLGALSNVYRNDSVQKTRMHIGKGVKLSYRDDSVYMEVLSFKPVFLLSSNLNISQRNSENSIVKCWPGKCIKIYDNLIFAELLRSRVPMGYRAVRSLTEKCNIKFSFVKGWGPSYPRTDILETPCWVELFLHAPMRWLDRVLMQMKGPTDPISSNTA